MKTPRKAASRRHRWCQRISELRRNPLLTPISAAYFFYSASANDVPATPIMETCTAYEHGASLCRIRAHGVGVGEHAAKKVWFHFILSHELSVLNEEDLHCTSSGFRNTLTPSMSARSGLARRFHNGASANAIHATTYRRHSAPSILARRRETPRARRRHSIHEFTSSPSPGSWGSQRVRSRGVHDEPFSSFIPRDLSPGINYRGFGVERGWSLG
jgi:hypothetical protein